MAATPITPNPTTPVTPAAAPPSDPSTAQLRDAAVAASSPAPVVAPPDPGAAAPPPVAPPAPEPYTVKEGPDGIEISLETGAVYKGKTWQEAVAQVAKGKVESDKTIKQMRTQPAPAPAPVDPAPAVAAQETPEQVQAREWVMQQFSQSKEGKAILEVIQQNQQSNLAAAFMQRCPDFPNTQEASDKLIELAEQMRVPPTPEGLEMAHLYAVHHKIYQAVTPVTPVSARPIPAPILNPSAPAAPGGTTDSDLRTMPMAQLRELAIKGRG